MSSQIPQIVCYCRSGSHLAIGLTIHPAVASDSLLLSLVWSAVLSACHGLSGFLRRHAAGQKRCGERYPDYCGPGNPHRPSERQVAFALYPYEAPCTRFWLVCAIMQKMLVVAFPRLVAKRVYARGDAHDFTVNAASKRHAHSANPRQ